jgi:hypothetical protein
MSIKEQKGELDDMSDKLKREVAKLHKDLVNKQTELNNIERNKKQSNAFDLVGNQPTINKKEIPGSSDIPDVQLLPRKQKRTENKW